MGYPMAILTLGDGRRMGTLVTKHARKCAVQGGIFAEIHGNLGMARLAKLDRRMTDRFDLQGMMGLMAAFALGHFRLIAMRLMAFPAVWLGTMCFMTENARVISVLALKIGKLLPLLCMAADTAVLGGKRELY